MEILKTRRITIDIDDRKALYSIISRVKRLFGDTSLELWKSSFKGFHLIFKVDFVMSEKEVNSLRWLLGDDVQRIWIDILKGKNLYKQVLFQRKIVKDGDFIKVGNAKKLFSGKLSELECDVSKHDYECFFKAILPEEPKIKRYEKRIFNHLEKQLLTKD